VIFVALSGALAFLLLLAWRDELALERDWNALIHATPAQAAYEHVRKTLLLEQRAVDFTWGRAAEEEAAGRREEALRLLAVGYEYLSGVTGDRLRLLRRLRLYSRMVSGIAPLPRFRRRLFVLQHGFRALLSIDQSDQQPGRFRVLTEDTCSALRTLLEATERAG
jgi:hypothetical protein